MDCSNKNQNNSFFKFLIKGARFELSESDNSLVSLLEPYYWNKENFLLVTPVFTGKTKAFLEIAESLKEEKILIISEKKYENLNCLRPDSNEEHDDFDYIIYDNVLPREYSNIKPHISIYCDYNQLPLDIYNQDNEDWYKKYIPSLLPESCSFSYICLPPKKQEIEFVFGTNDQIKHLCLENCIIDKNAVIFSKDPNRLFNKSINIISKITPETKCSQIIFLDIDLEGIKYSLNKFDHLTIIYTRNFAELIPLCALFDSNNRKLPNHIQRIIQTHNKNI